VAIQVPFPIPSSGYALNSKLRVNLDFIVSKFNEFNTGTATWDQVSIGTANNLTGVLTFYNSSNTNYLAFQPGVTGSSITYTLPIAVPGGTARPLISTAAGVMSWGDQAVQTTSTPTFAGITFSGFSGNVRVLTSTALQAVTELTNSQGVTGILIASSASTPKFVKLLGTSDQVSVAFNTDDTTLSLPQSIGTSSDVQFGSLRVAVGSTSACALRIGAANTGIIGVGANEVQVVIGGTPYVSVDNSGNLFATTGEIRGGNIRTLGNIQVSGATSGIATITAPASFTSYALVLPSNDGDSNQVLTTDGSGNLSWATPSGTGANTALSNLASVAINTSLVSDTDATDDLGSSSVGWKNIFVANNVAGPKIQWKHSTNSVTGYLYADSSVAGIGTFSNHPFIFFTNYGAAQLTLNTDTSATFGGTVKSDTNNTDDLGTSGVKWRTGYFGTSVNVAGSAPEVYIDSSGDAYSYIDRGATTNEAVLKFATAGTNYAGIGLDNDSTNNLAIFTNSDFGTPILIFSSSDVYTSDFTDYSSTSTVTGWSSFTTKEIFYKRIGKLVIAWFRIIGTSDATTASFTLPFTNNSSVPVNNCTFVSDNGTPQTTGGRVSLSTGSSTVNFFTNMASQAWTNSGTKQVGAGFIMYQTA
jgi:hypothetical protein